MAEDDGSPQPAIQWAIATDTPTFEIFRSQPNNWLTFNPSGIKIEMETGEVVIPEGLTLSDAARQFWEALSAFRRPGFW